MKTVLPNLRKATACKFWWQNGCGNQRVEKPDYPTVNGDRIVDAELLQRVKARNCLDAWTPSVAVMVGGRTLTFKGDQALKIWAAWKGLVYGTK